MENDFSINGNVIKDALLQEIAFFVDVPACGKVIDYSDLMISNKSFDKVGTYKAGPSCYKCFDRIT